jgi:choice-of-anchor B domain-containing protein
VTTRPSTRFLPVLAALFFASPVSSQSMPGAAAPPAAGLGGAVAVSGETLFVGEADNVSRPGLVYVYRRVGDAWTEVDRLGAPASARGDGFGETLAASGTTLMVRGPGGVHVFGREGDDWVAAGSLAASDAADGDGFGESIALEGDVALIGAPAHAGGGMVYVFLRDGDLWTETDRIIPAEGEGIRFGASIAFDGVRALISARGSGDRPGGIHVFDVDVASGTAIAAGVLPSRGGSGAGSGPALALRGETALVGSPDDAGGLGTVAIYQHGEQDWEPVELLLPYEASRRAAFGASVAFDEDERIWVGAPDAGVAYVLEWSAEDGGFDRVDRIAPAGGPEPSFGRALVVGEGFVAFGLPGADWGAGQAVVLQEVMDGWSEVARLLSEPDAFSEVTGAALECSQGEAGEFGCDGVDLVAYMPVEALGGDRGINVNDVWGWTDPETGREYALVGLRNQTSFVDVTDPANPVLVGDLPMTEGSQASVWRDIKTYRDYAFVVSDGAGPHGMQVIDLTKLRAFEGEPIQFQEDVVYDRIASAHNIVIDTETGYAFAVGASSGGETCGGGLHMIDIREPLTPVFAGCFADPETGRSGTGYTHDAQCVIYRGPDADYEGREICFAANETALSIADVTDKANPVALSRASYPNVAYSHQGWLTEDHRYFYMDDELDEVSGTVSATRTLIWDVVELEDPQLVGEYLGTTSASDHNLYVVGDRMYQSNYRSGLRILDITDPVNPREVSYFDTVPYGTDTPGMNGSWSNYPFFESGIVIVTSGREGLFIVRPRETRTIS